MSLHWVRDHADLMASSRFLSSDIVQFLNALERILLCQEIRSNKPSKMTAIITWLSSSTSLPLLLAVRVLSTLSRVGTHTTIRSPDCQAKSGCAKWISRDLTVLHFKRQLFLGHGSW
jgi:primosomal protein N''